MKIIGKRKSVVAALAVSSLILAACGSGSSSAASSTSTTGAAASSSTSASGSLTTVTVAYIPISLFEPLFVAMHDGYFTQHGIKVKLTVVPSGQSATTLAATNKVQVVLGGFSAGMFNAIHQGLNFKVVGSMAEEAPGTPANGLVVASSLASKVKNAGDLKGMKIAVSGGAGSTGAYLVSQALKPYNLTLKDVTLVNLAFPEMESALKSGAVAAAYPPAPFLGAIIKDKVGTLLSGAPVGVAAVGVIYGGAFAKTKAAQGFFDALVEASKKLQGSNVNSAANLAIVAKATGEKLSLLESVPPNVFSPTLAPPTKTLQSMQKVFLQSKNLDYTSLIPSSQYIDSTFSQNAS